jgi:hypothetical protein
MAGIITQCHADTGVPAFEDSTGEVRMLAKLKPDQEVRKMMSQAHDLFGAPVPRSQWKPIDRRNDLGSQFIVNQRNTSGCVGFSAVEAMMRQRFLRGYGFVFLSGAYVYSWINGGRDSGAMITDALKALVDHGAPLESTVPWNYIFRNQSKVGDVEAQRFRLRRGIAITQTDQATAFDWIVTALLKGFIPQFAIEVGNNFDNFDANGVAGFSAGYGNHSVHADGLVEINGKWYLDMPNSWGTSWGNQGRCLLSEKHIQTVVSNGGQDAFIHEDEIQDPQDPNNPTVPTS